ncbi:MAG: dihydrolipoyl dehydrogenase [Alphaproteobacteria bacterium]|nr:dihydrolipoyl dehydrogenase [Alphaproteobacteria bacterium]
MAAERFDLILIGGGPGGYVAAIRAAQLGMKVALVEQAELGGICLNWGCIPTKALLRTAEIYHLMQRAEAFGLKVEGVSFAFAKLIARSRQVAKRLSDGVAFLMKKHKVTVIAGRGRLSGGAHTVAVTRDGKPVAELTAPNVILATGARARTLPGLEPDGKLVWSYREAMVPKAMPKSLLVVGSGAIGIEFASFYCDLGAEVTVVEVLPRILPVEDEDISAFARKSFEKQGMRIVTSAKLAGLTRGNDSVTARIEAEGKSFEVTAERAISAVGIVGNVEDLGLEGTKIKVEKTHVVADQWLATGEPGVFAIGDLAGPPWLAHKAMHEGVVCVERIAGVKDTHPLDPAQVPGCTYSRPQIASIGLTEAKAKEGGRAVKIGKFPFSGNGKAIALGESDGFIKTIFDAKTGELLGAHMVGAEVTELIHGYALARTLETTEAELMRTVFPHPTLSEMLHESVLDAYGRALHF